MPISIQRFVPSIRFTSLPAVTMPAILCWICLSASGRADNWPMWRYDATRSAASTNTLVDAPQLSWSIDLTPRKQAWDDPLNLDLMTYDRVFEPIVMDGRLFIGFNDTDKLSAFDTNSGQELWSFYTEAPVRLPPVGWEGKVYFSSDDGFLYCVDAEQGKLIWKFNGAPSGQHAIGNQRFTSAWPARGGPVVRDGVVYFAASIWPFMGTFVYALNADQGEVTWVNDTTGSQYTKQPHSAPSFAGVAPQGALVATENALIVPGGRSVPAVFERSDGKLRYFEINAGGKGTGGSFVTANDKHFFVHTRRKGTRAFRLNDGVKTAFMPSEPVLTDKLIYSAESVKEQPVIRAYNADQSKADQSIVWELPIDGQGDLILAGNKLVAAGESAITIVGRGEDGASPQILDTIELNNVSVQRLIVADQKLFAVSLDGRLMAFGNRPATNDIDRSRASNDLAFSTESSEVAKTLLATGDAEGYAIWHGSWESPGLKALAANSPFTQLAIVSQHAADVDRMRRELDKASIYGRVTAHLSRADAFKAPQYVANMLFVDIDSLGPTFEINQLSNLYQSVRPYGGVMCVLTQSNHAQVAKQISDVGLEQATIEQAPFGVVIKREGSLPGSASWTHQYGSIANTLKSDDRRVKLPLGILWFGGSSNMDVLPRHGHGPPEQVIGGRLFIQGMNSISARDVYTGRVLWKREFNDLGTFDLYYDDTYENTPLDPKYNQVHIPGANARGTNYVATRDRIYVVEGNVCHALDPATGKTVNDFRIPTDESGGEPSWGYIGVYKNVLVGGVGFAEYGQRKHLTFPADKDLKKSRAGFGAKSLDRAASIGLIGFDRHTGEQLWQVAANHSFWHNGIVAGGDQIYCLDRNPKKVEEAMLRRGLARPETYRIVALDYRTGELNWQISEGIFGTWLGYSEKHNVLLQAGAKASDRLYDEVDRGMAAYDARTGETRWKDGQRKYAGPCILHNDLIITNANSYSDSAGAYFLTDGKPKLVENPLTGTLQPWRVTRAYGCNNIIASENLLTFRSGAAGFYDLKSQSGTGNLGGFKSGCTSNLVVADGVLNAPDYTRTCSCAYQNQTSLGLVHMPDVELWSVNSAASEQTVGQRVNHLGINFGAPGDRRDENGLLWVEHPVVAGKSPPMWIEFNQEAEFFQRHSSTLTDSDTPWIFASGARFVTDIRINLNLSASFGIKQGIPVSHIDDDAEENEQGSVNRTSSDLELSEDDQTQNIGLRFNNINLSPDATIINATIQFTCNEPSEGQASLIIAAENVGSARRFSEDDHDISSRPRTNAEVAWEPAAWKKKHESGPNQQTPDLKALIQEVIDRPDWKSGGSICFLITGTGKRVAVAGTAAAEKAPKLLIETKRPPRNDATLAERYDLDLYFTAAGPQHQEPVVFDLLIGDTVAAKNITLEPSDQRQRFKVQHLSNIAIADELHLQVVSRQGQPAVAGLSIIRCSEETSTPKSPTPKSLDQ